MRYIFLIFLFSSCLVNSFAQGPAATNEQFFFKSVYKKYPGSYFTLGTGHKFSDYYNSKTKKSVWTVSFLIMDSSKKDEQKYLSEVSDSILKKYLAGTHFYYGMQSCHFELGLRGLDFVAFTSNDEADYVFDTSATGFKNSFIKNITGITITGRHEKEQFASALLTMLTPELLLGYREFNMVRTNFNWATNKLTATNIYNKQEAYQTTNLYLVFEDDKLMEISLK